MTGPQVTEHTGAMHPCAVGRCRDRDLSSSGLAGRGQVPFHTCAGLRVRPASPGSSGRRRRSGPGRPVRARPSTRRFRRCGCHSRPTPRPLRRGDRSGRYAWRVSGLWARTGGWVNADAWRKATWMEGTRRLVNGTRIELVTSALGTPQMTPLSGRANRSLPAESTRAPLGSNTAQLPTVLYSHTQPMGSETGRIRRGHDASA